MRRKLELNGGFDLYYPLGTVVYDFLIWRANPRVLYTREYNEDRYNLDTIYCRRSNTNIEVIPQLRASMTHRRPETGSKVCLIISLRGVRLPASTAVNEI